MTERPIIFSGPMVKSILDVRKTQTRRLVRPQPPPVVGTLPQSLALVSDEAGDRLCAVSRRAGHGGWFSRCPYGDVGSLLWVRETWRVGAWDENDGAIAVDYRADGFCRREWLSLPESDESFNRLWEQSCNDAMAAGLKMDEEGRYNWKIGDSPCRWRSPIHMPRWASRITLEVTGVRVERLQEIGERDAEREGCPDDLKPLSLHWFKDQWDSINAKSAPWESNPWVWVISFRIFALAP